MSFSHHRSSFASSYVGLGLCDPSLPPSIFALMYIFSFWLRYPSPSSSRVSNVRCEAARVQKSAQNCLHPKTNCTNGEDEHRTWWCSSGTWCPKRFTKSSFDHPASGTSSLKPPSSAASTSPSATQARDVHETERVSKAQPRDSIRIRSRREARGRARYRC
jgi:hypothetical protein